MIHKPKLLSVSQAAALCRVGRTTVGYWVRSRKLFARRSGRNYRIPFEDLAHFLKSTGQPVPMELVCGEGSGPVYKSFRSCWTYWQGSGKGHRCEGCLVFRRRVADCFSARDKGRSGCPTACCQCRYYQEMFVDRFQFIHQIGSPAAVFRGLSLWGGNSLWSELCGVSEESLIGRGLETVIHPSCLADVISYLKQVALKEKAGLIPGPIFMTTPRREQRPASGWIFPLRQPEGTHLILASPGGAEPPES
jgi:excisionase family DNA binding protein